MPHTYRRFDVYLDAVPSNELKAMVRAWGGRSQMRKDECIATIRLGLSDPARVQAVLDSLTAYERTALALVKQMGGTIEAAALAVALRATGVDLPKERYPYSDDAATLVQPLIRRGLLLHSSGATIGAMWNAYHGGSVFSDERLLADVGPVGCVPFSIIATAPPPSSTHRRPSIVILDAVGVLQAIETLGGVRQTKAGTPRAGDVRKLARAMGWNERAREVEGCTFREPTLAWIDALQHAGLLAVRGDALALTSPIDAFAKRSYPEQVRTLLHGFIAARSWSEAEVPSWYAADARQVSARLALMLVLASLPSTSEGFFPIDDLDQALFDRVGEHFALRYLPRRPYAYNKSADEVRREEQAWRTKLHVDWLAFERRWLTAALSSWLYYLGIVELGLEDGVPISLRLTELGRTVLHSQPDERSDVPAAARSAWLVQPNFDVQVYLEQITPEQLAFLERHAERVQAHHYTAQYRLTRESVYRGLESGTSLEDVQSGLQRGMSMALPQNVVAELRGWATLREQIRLRRRARMLEYPDERTRQAAVAEGLAGTPVGDRFVLLTGSEAPRQEITARIDYSDHLPQCLSVTEDGEVTITNPTRDLVLEAQLDHWAERVAAGTWRLTAASVAGPVKAGVSRSVLFALLHERLTHPLPPLLGVALRAWTGERPHVELATITVLRCPKPAVLQAIMTSEKLRPYIQGSLAPDVVLVDTRGVKSVRDWLAWAGIAPQDVLDE